MHDGAAGVQWSGLMMREFEVGGRDVWWFRGRDVVRRMRSTGAQQSSEEKKKNAHSTLSWQTVVADCWGKLSGQTVCLARAKSGSIHTGMRWAGHTSCRSFLRS